MYDIQKPSENAAHNAADIYVRQFAKKKRFAKDSTAEREKQ